MIKLFKYLSPFKISLIVVLVLIFFQSLSQLYLPTLMSDIVDTGIVNGDTDYILRIGLFMLLVAAVGVICTVVASYLSSKITSSFGKILRSKVFTRVESFSLHEFDKIGTASLVTRSTNDITQIQQVTIMILNMVLSAPMMIIGGIIMAVSKDATLSLTIVFIIPFLAITIFFIAKKGIPLFKLVQIKLDKLNRVLREGLSGIRVIRAFNRIDYEKKRFKETNIDLTNTSIKVNKIMATLMPVMMLVINLSIVAIIWFGSIRIDNGHMQVGDLMAFIQYIMQILFSLIMVSFIFVMIPRASASAERINEVIETNPEIEDPSQIKKENSIGIVEFKDVTFHYPGAEEPALSHISFTSNPGEITAIIGSTGSGKSTLLNLILRFYDVSDGKISVGGIDVKDTTQENLRSKISYVPQESVLFTGTITENIRYGKKDATFEEVTDAAEIAQATEFISIMDDEFDSVIAQGGKNLSGGQKQRIAIARALVRRPEIYIFDDSFSALDFKTDAKLRVALRKEMKQSTVLIVAQRVSTVMNADKIIVLNEGEITGIGKHKELLKTCDVYREIVSSQLSEEELA